MQITAPRIAALGLVAAVGWAAHAVANEAAARPTIVGEIAGVPAVAVAAYQQAAQLAPPDCHLPASLVAAIGAVESGHGTYGDSQPDPVTGDVTPPIRGPQLDGVQFALIWDSDDGALDGDPIYDRAVGPVQFIPTTWAHYADPDDDPQNLYDSAKNTGRLLCAVATNEGRPITDPDVERAAILAYNHSDEYVDTVLQFKADFDTLGIDTLPTIAGGRDLTPAAIASKLGETGRARWADLGQAIDRQGAHRVRPVFDAADPVARALWNTLDSTPGEALATKEATRVISGTPTGQLETVGGITVDSSIAGQLEELLADAQADGITLTGSGWRSNAEQIDLRRAHCGPSDYAIYQMPSGECSPPTARPGTSNHETGVAVDFRDGNGNSLTASSPGFQWLVVNAARYGLHNLPSEPWHWSVDGS